MIIARMRQPSPGAHGSPIGYVQMQILKMLMKVPPDAEAPAGKLSSRDPLRPHVLTDMLTTPFVTMKPESGGRYKFVITKAGREMVRNGLVAAPPKTGTKRAPRGSLLAAQRAKRRPAARMKAAKGKRKTA